MNRSKPKIIYIWNIPCTEKIERDYFIKDLISKNYQVEYWDLSCLLFKYDDFVYKIKRNYIRKIKSYEELKSLLSQQDNLNTLYMIIYRPLRLYRMLSKFNVKLLYFERGCLPQLSNRSLISKIRQKTVSLFNIEKISGFFSQKTTAILKRIKMLKEIDIVFAAGEVGENMHRDTSMVVPVNFFDYDEYVKVKSEDRCLVNGRYCVYLDDNIVDDPDFVIFRVKTVKADAYYNALNRFFKYIEDIYKVKVVIAAHPKAVYERNPFDGREIYRFETCTLAKGCEFALAHFSTSVSFPVLFKKPVIFMYTSEMKKMAYFKTINSFAEALNRSVVNIDLVDPEKFDFKKVDIGKYEEYRLKYITSLGPDAKNSRDIFLKFIESLSS